MANLISSDRLLSLTAVLISVLTLVVFIFQTNLIRKHQYTSVLPYLSMSNVKSGTISYQFRLSNDGIGPAILDSCVVTYKDTSYHELIDYVEEQLADNDSILIVYANVYPGMIIPPDREVKLIQMLDKQLIAELGLEDADLVENTPLGSMVLRQIINNDSLDMKMYYSSIYGERWVVSMNDSAPRKLE